MANTIRHKRGTTTPLAANLVTGEIAINTSTGAAFTKTDAGSVVQIGGGGTWGSITGTLSSQTDLNTALGLKAPLASPTFTGTPAAPTATTGDSTTALATTAFVQQELASGVAVAKDVVSIVRNETGSTITKGSVVYINGAGGNKATVALALATSDPTSASTYGLVMNDIADNQNGYVITVGVISGINTNDYPAGTMLYLSTTTAGGVTSTKPSAPDHMVSIGVVTYQHANQGAIQLSIRNGFEVEELHNAAISSVANNDLFVYESSTSLWKNKSFTTLGLLTDAPSDGSEYVRLNGAWSVATGGGGGGAAAIPAYNNGVTYTVGQQVIFNDRFWYMSTAVGGAGYDPIGYPSYWTEISAGGGGGGGTWGSITGTVTDQTDLTSYISNAYLPLAGGTMTGAINFGTGGQNIDQGTFDSGRFGSNGISLKCAVGFELNWQAGWLTGNQFLGTPSICPIYIDSGAGSTLCVWEGTTGTGIEISHTEITFPDLTTQTTAAIPDAPSDGSNYGRLNGAWAATLPDAPSDSTQYVRQNGSWVANSGFTFGDAPSDGNHYVRNSGSWYQIGAGTDSIATQQFVTSQGYATTGDVSTAVTGLVTASNARLNALVESFRASINDANIFVDGSNYLNIPFNTGAFNICVSTSQFSSTGKWFGILEPVSGSFISPAMSVSLSSSVVTMTFSYSSVYTASGIYYTEDGGTTWVESTLKLS